MPPKHGSSPAIDDAITKLQHRRQDRRPNCSRSGLPPKLATLATGYLATFRADITNAITNMVDELVDSPKLATIWDNANAALHTKFVQVMQGAEPGKLHTLNVDLSSAVAAGQTETGIRPASTGRRKSPMSRW